MTCGLLLSSTLLQAKTDHRILMQNAVQQHNKNTKQAPKEIVEGLQDTFSALAALQKKQNDTATKLLEKATTSFDTALKKNPALGLVPIDEQVQIFEFTGNADMIAKRIKWAQKLLEVHDTQAAIDTLVPLKDELDIMVVSIPMDLYPVATKQAYEALQKGNINKAVAALTTALGSLVTTKVVIPTPLLVIQDLITEASKLDKTKKADAQKLLAAAQEEIKRAELLGYTSKYAAVYKHVEKEISQIKQEIKGKNHVEKLYETLKNDIKNIVAKTHISKVKVASPYSSISNSGLPDSVGAKEQKALNNPSSVKDHAAAAAKVEETMDKDAFKTKMDSSAFNKEVKKDVKEVETPNEVKTINKEDKNNPYQ